MNDTAQPSAGIVCVRCRQKGLSSAEVYMSGDGWLCESCYKQWNRQEERKQPKPIFYSDKGPIDLDELPQYSDKDFVISKRWSALRWMGLGVVMMAVGAIGTSILVDILTNGGRLSGVIG